MKNWAVVRRLDPHIEEEVTLEMKRSWELKAYTIEIKEAKRLGLDNIAEQLQKNFEAEKQYILDRYGPIIE
ncbi:hypothetical protein [Paenibacillus xylanexedens]|uniref:hypothetical protein n=1 Tax=Paenibacillus xylanexedens TaxID=528191 RepID=UPI0011A0D2CD|nr:hypothetical protein [Paenibacillus xylanexedens]